MDDTPGPLGLVWEWQHSVLDGDVGGWRHLVCTNSVVRVVRIWDCEVDMG